MLFLLHGVINALKLVIQSTEGKHSLNGLTLLLLKNVLKFKERLKMKLKHLSTAMILATLPATGVLQQL